ncbi:hypothetical protein BDR26DRAFT_896976 [Obelidium mucronatum]|nr:hypothetical protein BDR26DRAFT_896976 [Obelidium mucronatum]
MNDSMSDEWPDAPPAVSTSTINSDASPPVNSESESRHSRQGSWSGLNAEAPCIRHSNEGNSSMQQQQPTRFWFGDVETSDGKSLGFVRHVDVWGGGGGVRTSPAAHTTKDSNHSINEVKPKLESDASDDEWGPPEANGRICKTGTQTVEFHFCLPVFNQSYITIILIHQMSSNPESFKREQAATCLPTNDSAATLLSTPQLDITQQTEISIENESPTQDVDYGVEESEIYVGTLDSCEFTLQDQERGTAGSARPAVPIPY